MQCLDFRISRWKVSRHRTSSRTRSSASLRIRTATRSPVRCCFASSIASKRSCSRRWPGRAGMRTRAMTSHRCPHPRCRNRSLREGGQGRRSPGQHRPEPPPGPHHRRPRAAGSVPGRPFAPWGSDRLSPEVGIWQAAIRKRLDPARPRAGRWLRHAHRDNVASDPRRPSFYAVRSHPAWQSLFPDPVLRGVRAHRSTAALPTAWRSGGSMPCRAASAPMPIINDQPGPQAASWLDPHLGRSCPTSIPTS